MAKDTDQLLSHIHTGVRDVEDVRAGIGQGWSDARFECALERLQVQGRAVVWHPSVFGGQRYVKAVDIMPLPGLTAADLARDVAGVLQLALYYRKSRGAWPLLDDLEDNGLATARVLRAAEALVAIKHAAVSRGGRLEVYAVGEAP